MRVCSVEYAPWARCDGVCVICLFVLYGARTVVCVCAVLAVRAM